MNPTAPATNPTTTNTNQAFGGFGQVQNDYATAAGILSNLPNQEAQTTTNATNANNNPGSILPNISVNAPTFTAPTAQSINPASFGTNLTGYNTATQNAMNALTQGENTTYGQALGTLQQAEQQYGNLTPVYQQLASEYNIPGYQNDIATLSGLLQNLRQDVNTRTTLGGGLMTQSAQDETYANEANPLNLALSNASEFLNYGQQDVNNLLGTYEKSLTNALTPLQANISNLPELFGQTNQAAQTGYQQGQQSIQDTIQNRINQQQANAYTTMANVSVQTLKDEYGEGAAAVAGNLASDPTALNVGVNFKNGKNGSNGYDFTVNGKAASMGQWAIANSSKLYGATANEAQAIISTLTGLAGGGDNYSAQALAAIQATAASNGGQPVITQDIINKYPALFGGFTTSSNNTSGNTNKSSAPQIGAPTSLDSATTNLLGQPLARLGPSYG